MIARRVLFVLFVGLLSSFAAPGQTYTINTVSGSTLPLNSLQFPGAAGVSTGPSSVAADAGGNLFFPVGGLVLRLDAATGILTVVAGGGTNNPGDNGLATSASISPQGVAVDSADNIFIASSSKIRKVSNGVITTVAGNGTAGFSGDGGPATSAELNGALAVAVDSAGNLYIADQLNFRIRKVANGIITTVAGGGTSFPGDNGPATSATLNNPEGIAVDVAGNIYFTDNLACIAKVSNGVLTIIAGNDVGVGFTGDGGPAANAELSFPDSLAVDSAGNVYVADSGNGRVRVLTPGASTIPSCIYSVLPASLQAPAVGDGLPVSIQTGASCAWTVSGLPSWITTASLSGTGPATITLTAAPNNSGSALSATILVAGTSIAVTQPSTTACTYAISPAIQAVSAAGGNQTVSVTAPAGCRWSATSSVSWITITSGATGTGNGTIGYFVAANSGSTQSGIIAIANQSFTVQEAAAASGLIFAGSMAQIASSGFWTTTITLVNTSSTAAQALLNFFDDDGSSLILPWIFPQQSGLSPTLASTIQQTINPGAELLLQTTGPVSQPVTEGWAQLLSNGSISGSAIFSAAIGSSVQDAVAPLETRNASAYVVSFDNTNGNSAGVALANLTSQALTVSVTIHDDTGVVIPSGALALPAMGHASFVMTTQFGSAVTQKRGTIAFSTPGPGQISVIGIRANASGAFSDIPPLAQ